MGHIGALIVIFLGSFLALVGVAGFHGLHHGQMVVHGGAVELVALLVEGGRRPVVPMALHRIGARLLGRAEVAYLAVGVHAVVGEGEVRGRVLVARAA